MKKESHYIITEVTGAVHLERLGECLLRKVGAWNNTGGYCDPEWTSPGGDPSDHDLRLIETGLSCLVASALLTLQQFVAGGAFEVGAQSGEPWDHE